MRREYGGWGGYPVRHGSYEEYDHSDQEIDVYDQCCQNCRYYDALECRCKRRYTVFRNETDWCVDWKGKGGRY